MLQHDGSIGPLIGERLKRAGEVIGRAGLRQDDIDAERSSRILQLQPLRPGLRVIGVAKNADPAGTRHDLARKLHLFGRQSRHVRRDPGHVPCGRASLATRPRCTASASAGVTIGIVVVAFLAATAWAVAGARMTLGLSRTSSCASAGNRSA